MPTYKKCTTIGSQRESEDNIKKRKLDVQMKVERMLARENVLVKEVQVGRFLRKEGMDFGTALCR